MTRSVELEAFLACAQNAITSRVEPDSAPAKAMQRVAVALSSPVPSRPPPTPCRLPACAHLLPAIDLLRRSAPDLAPLADALQALAPQMTWRQKSTDDPVFARGHANSDIVGADANALEQRADVRLGLSLMAPDLTYPDHDHPPEEVYIALSDSDWRQNANPWHAPGIGGIVYNPRNIVHAMRSRSSPLLAIWCLPIDAS